MASIQQHPVDKLSFTMKAFMGVCNTCCCRPHKHMPMRILNILVQLSTWECFFLLIYFFQCLCLCFFYKESKTINLMKFFVVFAAFVKSFLSFIVMSLVTYQILHQSGHGSLLLTTTGKYWPRLHVCMCVITSATPISCKACVKHKCLLL